MTWELAIQLILAIVAASGAVGSFYAIRKQLKMEKLQQKKLIVEAESISAEVAAKLIDSAGNLQEFYEKLFEELREQISEQSVIICRLEIKIEEQNTKIEALCEQVRELGQEPRYTKEK